MARDLKYTNNIDAKLLLNLKIKVKKCTPFLSKYRLDTTIIAHGIAHSICANILLLQNFVELPEISINNFLYTFVVQIQECHRII
jgi:hypothetical protein